MHEYDGIYSNIPQAGDVPFIIRLYDWKSNRHKDVQEVIKSQAQNTSLEFAERVKGIILQFAEQVSPLVDEV